MACRKKKLFIELSQQRLAQLGLDIHQVLAQLGQQNAVEGAGEACKARTTRCRCVLPGSSVAPRSCEPCPFVAARARRAWAILRRSRAATLIHHW